MVTLFLPLAINAAVARELAIYDILRYFLPSCYTSKSIMAVFHLEIALPDFEIVNTRGNLEIAQRHLTITWPAQIHDAIVSVREWTCLPTFSLILHWSSAVFMCSTIYDACPSMSSLLIFLEGKSVESSKKHRPLFLICKWIFDQRLTTTITQAPRIS